MSSIATAQPALADGAARTEDEQELERVALRRTTRRLIPFLMICYAVAYLARVNISFASVQMNKALGLSSTAYGLGAGLFFLTYCLCEVPSNLVLYKVGASRWIARIMFSLGLCAGGMALVTGPQSFYAMRLILGAAEAGFYPGVLFLLTLWFPQAHRGRILGMFIAAIPISGIIGAPLSGLLLGLDGIWGLQGWQWMYLVEAAPALILAPMVLRRLQDGPAEARWMPDAERVWLLAQLAKERSAAERTRTYSVRECLTNPRVLFLGMMYFSNVCLLNSITFFMPQIVKGFGLSASQTGLVLAIPSLLALGALLWWGRRSDRNQDRFGHAAFANLAGGTALMISVMVSEPTLRMAALAVAFASTLSFASPFWAIPGTFLTGGAVAGGIGVISALGVTGGFLSPWFIGWVKDTLGDLSYGLGAIALLAIAAAAALAAFGRAERLRQAQT